MLAINVAKCYFAWKWQTFPFVMLTYCWQKSRAKWRLPQKSYNITYTDASVYPPYFLVFLTPPLEVATKQFPCPSNPDWLHFIGTGKGDKHSVLVAFNLHKEHHSRPASWILYESYLSTNLSYVLFSLPVMFWSCPPDDLNNGWLWRCVW